MKLKNKFAFGVLFQWYEIGMIEEHLRALVQMIEGIENPEHLTFDFCISYQTYLEDIDWEKIEADFPKSFDRNFMTKLDSVQDIFKNLLEGFGFNQRTKKGKNVNVFGKFNGEPFYNIASYRRDFNFKYAQEADLICWSETDSLWPKQTLELLDHLHESVKGETPKYIFNFADRRLWDNSFAPLHPMFDDVPFQEDEGWQFNSPASGKGYMKLEKMNLINNIPFEEIQIVSFENPRFDGSCVCFSSDLIKSGVNIPHGLLHCSEDVSLGIMARKLLGDQFVQYCAINILHVHNRRHPEKRNYILNEDNKRGFCDNRKGEWWKILEDSSKQNFNNLFQQKPFIKMDEVLEKINASKK